MERTIEELIEELKDGIARTNNVREIYELVSTFNAFRLELIKAKIKQNRLLIKDYDIPRTWPNCYDDHVETLFSLFEPNECISGIDIDHYDKIKLLLLDNNHILQLRHYRDCTSYENVDDLDARLIRINDCKAKVYDASVYCGDPYYCDTHFENKKAFGLFEDDELLSYSLKYDSIYNKYDNKDIRDILKVQSIDDILDKMNTAIDVKVRKLIK